MNRRIAITRLAIIAVVLAVLSLNLSAAEKITTISAEDLHARLAGNSKPLVIDVREKDEWEEGHIAGAVLKPLGTVGSLDAPKDREIVLYCTAGTRSGEAYETLARRGYTKLANLQGGVIAWQKAGFALVK